MAKQSEMLSKAIALAAKHHEGQLDKGGKPYILHPLHVMHKLKTNDYELQQIAVMHDLIEDTEVTLELLTSMGFSKRVTDALALLTHMPTVSYEEYIEDIATDLDASYVKLHDLDHNSDFRRLKGVSEKDLARHAKYMRAYHYLEGKLKEWWISDSYI